MLPKYAVENRTVITFCVMLIVVGGIWSYFSMGRLEDPEFTIRTAIVATIYPGATAQEVDSRVTEVVERHIRRVAGVKTTRAQSRPGMSLIYVDMLDDFPPGKLSQAWQELRNKMSEARLELPVEAMSPMVKDDFGDVFGIILALTGDGYSDAELRDRAKRLQRELITVDQVGRVELWGIREETIEVNISRSRMAELSIHPAMIMLALAKQNFQTDAGRMTVDNQDIRLIPGGTFNDVEEIGELIIPSGRLDLLIESVTGGILEGRTAPIAALLGSSGAVGPTPIRLKDIATIRRTYADPPSEIMRSDGKSAVGIAIAPVSGGDVIRMGKSVQKRVDEILAEFPVGFQIDRVCYQPDNVVQAIGVFEGNLREAIIIVAVVVMIAMGWRSGIIITFSLLVVILATLCILHPMGVVLQRTSLGAFIVALGILVDDAVVVGDMILVNMQRGMNRKDACIEGARHVGHQLLGATIVGALAFFPVYLSPDATGEYCRDLFVVVAVSLGVSWFVAMMQTPVVYYDFIHVDRLAADQGSTTNVLDKTLSYSSATVNEGGLEQQTEVSSVHSITDQRPTEAGQNNKRKLDSGGNALALPDPHSGPVYQSYKKSLCWVLHHKTFTLIVLLCVLTSAVYGFSHVRKIFFPPAQRAQFLIEYWLPEGSSIHAVAKDFESMEQYLLGLRDNGVTEVASFIGSGAPRFYLPYDPEPPSPSYGTIIVNVRKTKDVDKLIVPVENHLKDAFPQGLVRTRRFALSPVTPNEIEVRFRGPDHAVLHELAEKIKAVFRAHPKAKDVTDNWHEPILVWRPEYSQVKGLRSMMGRTEMNLALRWASQGIPSAVYIENDNLIPIILRGTQEERNDLTNIGNVPVWGLGMHSVPLEHLIAASQFEWQPSRIHRRNGIATITVGCDPHDDTAWNELFADLKKDIEAISVPDGYSMEWGGQKEKSVEAETMLLGKTPIALVLIAIIVVALFNSMRQPLIIALSFPLMLIGITFGLLLTGFSFGFMALVGAMSLLGMTVRNGVVLMSQIDVELSKGESPYEAVVSASVERMRPVTVAAMTVVVGMVPLLRDPLFNSMAAAIMFGLIFATALTLFVVPTLYMIFFGIKPEP